MLSLLKIKNIALIDSLEVEFGAGLNLLTGETGSGKSIIVDSLGALTGERVSTDVIKEGEQSATIEGLFSILRSKELATAFDEGGIEIDDSPEVDLIVRRELSRVGKNRVFVNNQLVTQGFLKRIGELVVDIHGQGEQASLFDPKTHREMFDAYAGATKELTECADSYGRWSAIAKELAELRRDESDKLQMIDILRFQVEEISGANLTLGEDAELEAEKKKLNNVEKLSTLSDDAYRLLYEQDDSTLGTLDKAVKKIEELAEFDDRFGEYLETLSGSRAVLEDAATTARDFHAHLEFSPGRLEEIENRLAEISRVTRKYGGTIDTAIDHLAESERRLENIETAEFRQQELEKQMADARAAYLETARRLHDKRAAAKPKFEKELETNLKTVALDKARFEVRIEADESADRSFSPAGIDHVEFYFSANPGESPKPIAKIASGGEASRLMLILKTTANAGADDKAVVFDEIDSGIGGRVAEAVGLRLKQLAADQQVLCVTHQAQVAALADRHFAVEKSSGRNRTSVSIRELNPDERIDEVARMLAGEKITESARTHASEMIGSAQNSRARNAKR